MPLNKIIDSRITEANTITEPVDLATAKNWIRVSGTDDDTLIADLITMCRQAVENFCSISIVHKTVIINAEINMERTCEISEFELPLGPVKYTALSDVIITFKNGPKTTDYISQALDTDYYIDGLDFLVVRFPVPGVYKIQYDVLMATVPQQLKHAILTEIAYRYEYRGDNLNDAGICVTAQEKALPFKRLTWL